MPYPTLTDLRLRADTAGLTDDSLTNGLSSAVQLVESYCGRTFGNVVDPGTGLVRVVGTPASIAMVISGLAVYYAGNLYSRIPDRMTSIQTDMGLANIGTPDRSIGRPTGFPDWDVVLVGMRFSTPSAW